MCIRDRLKAKPHPLSKASGVRVEGKVTAICGGRELAGDQGELQITSYGISGIPVFQISRHIALALAQGESAQVGVDLVPWMEEEKLSLIHISLGIPLVQGLRLLVNGPSDQLAQLPEPDEDCVMEPVSYTHLDVYKIQPLPLPCPAM